VFAIASAALLAVVVPKTVGQIDRTIPGFFVWDNGVLVALHRAEWTGARSGLPLNGGMLVAVDGDAFPGGRAFMRDVAARSPGESVSYQLRFGGETIESRVPTMRFGLADWTLTLGSYLLNAFVLLFCAALALLLRPDHLHPRALAVASGTVGATILFVVDALTEFRFVQVARVGEALIPATVVNLALVFPRELVAARTRWLTALALALGLLGAHGFASIAYYSDPLASRVVTEVTYISIALSVLLLLGNYAYSLLRASNSDALTRAAVVCAGGMPAFALAGFGILAFNLLEWTFSWSWVFILLPLAPLSMLYAAVAQDLFDAERVLRLSVGYMLATGSLVVAYAAALAGVDRLVVGGASENHASTFMLLLVAALLFDPVRRRIQRGVDRAFYRSRLDFTHRLTEASEELPTLRDENEIERFVTRHLEEDLQVEFARLRLGDEATGPAALSQPVAFRGELLGTLECGEKRSGAPFAPEERALVKSLAGQTALALHNARTLEGLRSAEARLHTQDRLAAVGEFAGAVAHGIRNPLSGIRAGAQVAATQTESTSARETLSQVVSEANRLEQRIRSLLHFAEPYALHRQRVELGALLSETVRITASLAERAGVTLEVEIPDVPIFREVDPDYLVQGLLELAKNGIEAMPEGGRLRLALSGENAHTTIRVSDTGVGIPVDHRERVFDLFFTTRREGTGIGLASVKRIVEAHGGSLSVETEAGRGTTFTIQLDGQ
jgi:signal transduction histidine kinase